MKETKYTLSIETVRRLPARWFAVAFAVGDLWGHFSHGAPWEHRTLSALTSFGAAWIILGIPWRRIRAVRPWKDFMVRAPGAGEEP